MLGELQELSGGQGVYITSLTWHGYPRCPPQHGDPLYLIDLECFFPRSRPIRRLINLRTAQKCLSRTKRSVPRIMPLNALARGSLSMSRRIHSPTSMATQSDINNPAIPIEHISIRESLVPLNNSPLTQFTPVILELKNQRNRPRLPGSVGAATGHELLSLVLVGPAQSGRTTHCRLKPKPPLRQKIGWCSRIWGWS